MIPFIQTRQGLNVYVGGEMVEVPNTHQDFEEVREIIKRDEPDAGEQIKTIMTRVVTAIANSIAAQPDSGVTFESGLVYYNGQELHNSLTDRIVTMFDEGFSIDPLLRFLEKLMQNPSFRVVNSLYDFLEAGKIPITEDGDFLAYKAIRKDWKDIHSGKFDNSVGKVLSMPRNQVDENSANTCSNGLHVCSWDYLPNFAHSDGRVVIVKVSPADVVAIPADYNNTKMRTAKYEVVSEYLDYYAKDPHNLLSSKSVFTGFGTPNGLYDENEEEEFECEEFDEYDSYGFPNW